MLSRLQEWAADRGWCQYPPQRRSHGATPDFTAVLTSYSLAAILGVWGLLGMVTGMGAVAVGGFVLYVLITGA